MQAVVFLYLMDNSENTSWMILASQGFGILLEAWKITKSVDVRVRPPPANSPLSFLPYVIVFEDKHKLSETEQKTKEYDEIAFRYLYIVAVPLLAAYAVYSLMYNTHKSWYSYIIETLVGSVYAYGFLMMVPSLYINYRLKVTHLTLPVNDANHTVRCPHARQSTDLQVPKHLHRRPLRLYRAHAVASPSRNVARRRDLLHLGLPELEIQGRLQARQRVRAGR